jgi:hypothetical protein
MADPDAPNLLLGDLLVKNRQRAHSPPDWHPPVVLNHEAQTGDLLRHPHAAAPRLDQAAKLAVLEYFVATALVAAADGWP